MDCNQIIQGRAEEVRKYQIIYADPPWRFITWSEKGGGRGAKNHYEVMRLIDIFNLPLSQITDENCILFLWAVFPMLPEALETIKQWGFYYKTIGFNWVKRNKKKNSWFWGMGYWTRANSEICLLATKGNPKRASAKVHSVLDDRVMKHSQKPDTAKKRIVELMGDLPRIELFAREKTEGWDVWGNEVESDIELRTQGRPTASI